MRHRGNSFAACCIAALLSLSTGAALAQTGAEQAATAEALFREGRDLAAKGKYADACPKFAASQRLDPGYGTQWNLADCLEKLGRSASAWAAFREAADMASKAGQADREVKATRRANDLEKKLQRLVVSVQAPVPGLVVKRGGVALDEAAWGASLPVDPGKQLIEASAPGKKPFSTEAQTAGPGKAVTVEIPPLEDAPVDVAAVQAQPPDASVAQPAAAPTAADDGSAETRRTLAYVAGGVGLAGLVVGSVFGLSASSKWSEAQDEHCTTEDLCDATGVSLVDDAKTAATFSNIGFVLGGVGVAAGVALFVTSLGGPKPASTGLVVTPVVGPGALGVDVLGRF